MLLHSARVEPESRWHVYTSRSTPTPGMHLGCAAKPLLTHHVHLHLHLLSQPSVYHKINWSIPRFCYVNRAHLTVSASVHLQHLTFYASTESYETQNRSITPSGKFGVHTPSCPSRWSFHQCVNDHRPTLNIGCSSPPVNQLWVMPSAEP